VSRLLKKVREKANAKRRSTPGDARRVLTVVFYSVFFLKIYQKIILKKLFLILISQNNLKISKNNLK